MKAEVNIQSLLDRIKEEGIEKANKEAEEILEKARAKAASLIEGAEEQAEKIVHEARAEVERTQKAFKTAMAQAGHNLILSLKSEIMRFCDHIVERQVATAMTSDVMKEMILKMVDRWLTQEAGQGLEVLLNEKDLRTLEDLLYRELQDQLKQGLVLKPVESIRAGFRIGERDGHMHYDFTTKGIAEVLSEYLGPRIAMFLEDIPDESTG